MAVEYDLVVIGGGSGGLVVASAAAQLKAKVALIERDRLGGDCLWFGCVPSKSLIHASRVAYEVKNAAKFGIYTDNYNINFAKVASHVQQVISTIQPHDSPERFESLGVEVIFGDGQFLDNKTFSINGRKLTARAFVISTGSRAAIPNIPGLNQAGFLTNEQIFSIQNCPESLAIFGGGPIGCELGQAFSRLGSKVTILSSRNQILPKEDPEAAKVVQDQLLSENIVILNNTKAERVEIENGKKKIIAGNNIILADEINRTPPKTQAALLEAMQEKSVTIGGKLHHLVEPFFVLATQNPIEQEGTYPLPEAQLDRFMFNVLLDYPRLEEEIEVDELCCLFKNWVKQQNEELLLSNGNISEENVVKILKHFFPNVEIVEDKYVLNISCTMWNKIKDITKSFEFIKNELNAPKIIK